MAPTDRVPTAPWRRLDALCARGATRVTERLRADVAAFLAAERALAERELLMLARRFRGQIELAAALAEHPSAGPDLLAFLLREAASPRLLQVLQDRPDLTRAPALHAALAPLMRGSPPSWFHALYAVGADADRYREICDRLVDAGQSHMAGWLLAHGTPEQHVACTDEALGRWAHSTIDRLAAAALAVLAARHAPPRSPTSSAAIPTRLPSTPTTTLSPTDRTTSPIAPRRVVGLVDDIDGDRAQAGTPPCNAHGRSYGCKLVDGAGLDCATEDALVDSIQAAEALVRVYGPSEPAARRAARAAAEAEGWVSVDSWDSLLPPDAT